MVNPILLALALHLPAGKACVPIAKAIPEDTPLEDAALALVWANYESACQLDPKPLHDAQARGPWQLHGLAPWPQPLPSLPAQAKRWLSLLAAGRESCPEEPLAPLSGHCLRAAPLAHRRAALTARLLAAARALAHPMAPPPQPPQDAPGRAPDAPPPPAQPPTPRRTWGGA